MNPTPEIREVFHFLFLQKLFEISDPFLYALKGGVNLRFFFNSPRYSEDMDIDVFGGSIATLKKNGYKILDDKALKRSLRSFGIRDLEINDPAKAKQTATTQRFRLRLITDAGIPLPTKVEFSRRDTITDEVLTENIPGEVARQYGRLGFPCRHYGGNAAFLQKIRALIGRETPQCLDVFDLHILIAAGYGSKKMVQENFGTSEIEQAVSTVNGLEFKSYIGQVVEFLNPKERTRKNKVQAWDEIRLEVLELLSYA